MPKTKGVLSEAKEDKPVDNKSANSVEEMNDQDAQRKINGTLKRGEFRKLLLDTMVEYWEKQDFDYSKPVREELSRMLFRKHNIKKTELQIQKEINGWNLIQQMELPKKFKTEEERNNFENVRNRLFGQEKESSRPRVHQGRKRKPSVHKMTIKPNGRRPRVDEEAENNQLNASKRKKRKEDETQLLRTELEVVFTNQRMPEHQEAVAKDEENREDEQNEDVSLLGPLDNNEMRNELEAENVDERRHDGEQQKENQGVLVREKKKTLNETFKKKLQEAQNEIKVSQKKQLAEEKSRKTSIQREVFTNVNEEDIRDPELLCLLGIKNTVVKNKYEVHNVIGYGGFGVVFRVTQRVTGEEMAMKCVPYVESATTELNLMKQMRKYKPMNEFLCLPTNSFEVEHFGAKFRCFLMELLQVDLWTMCFKPEHESKVFPPLTVLTVMAQVSSACAFLNQGGIIHSDVKLENVMIKEYRVVKEEGKEVVLDAVVRLIDLNIIANVSDSPCLFQTVNIRAPEILLEAWLDTKLDSWCIGILGIELLLKRHLIYMEYNTNDIMMIYEHIARIEHAVGKKIPNYIWGKSDLKKRNVPKAPKEQRTLEDVFSTMDGTIHSDFLQKTIRNVLEVDPRARSSPADIEALLKEFIPSS